MVRDQTKVPGAKGIESIQRCKTTGDNWATLAGVRPMSNVKRGFLYLKSGSNFRPLDCISYFSRGNVF